MKLIFNMFKSEIYKFVHSNLIYIHLFIPVLGIAVFLSYYKISLWSETDKVSAYLQALAIAYPVLISIITTMSVELELQAGHFQMLFTVAVKVSTTHLVKLFLLLMTGLVSVFVAVLGFAIGFKFMGNDLFLTSFYLKAALLLFLGNLPLYILHYIVGFAFNKGVGLGVGIVGSLISALLLTGLGEKIWFYMLWSISVRLCSILVKCEELDIKFTDWINVEKGFLFISIASIILIMLLILWSNKWEAICYDRE